MIRMRQHFVAEIVDHTFYRERLVSGILHVILMLWPLSHRHRTLTVPLMANHSIGVDDDDDDSNAVWVMKVYHPMMHYSCLLRIMKKKKKKRKELKSNEIELRGSGRKKVTIKKESDTYH